MTCSNEKIKNFIKELEIKKYISGPISFSNLKPQKINKSGFMVFLTKNNSIIKILAEKTDQSLEAEIIFYTKIVPKEKKIKNLVPKLINHKSDFPQFIELEYLKGYKPLGTIQEIKKINKKLLKKLILTIHKFHFKLPKDIPLKEKEKFFPESTKNHLYKFFNIDPNLFENKLKQIFNSVKNKTFVTGDRNPSQIMINHKKKDIKLIDFNFCGIGSPALDFTYLLLTLLPNYETLENFYLDLLKKLYPNTEFWKVFSIDIAFRCIDNYHFWLIEKRNQSLAEKIKKRFWYYYNLVK